KIKQLIKFFTKSPKHSEYLDTAQQEFQQRGLSLPIFLTQNQNITEADMSGDSDKENLDNSDDEITNIASQNTNQNHTTQAILKTLQHTIYDSLFDYWGEPLMPGLLATLLDPRLKTLANWSNDIQDMAKKEL
ncbi:14440_t:CDS:2, partial [Racocetra fulgida]